MFGTHDKVQAIINKIEKFNKSKSLFLQARVEVAPENLYLSNHIVGASSKTYPGYTGGYVAEYESRYKIIVGKTDANGNNIYSLYNNQDYLSPNDNFIVDNGSRAIFHSGDQIELLPGFGVENGAMADVYIQSYNCSNLLFRVNNSSSDSQNNTNNWQLPDKGFDYEKPINKQKNKPITSFLLYPNPNNGNFSYINVCEEQTSKLIISDINGRVVYENMINNNAPYDLDLTRLPTGFYVAQVINKTNSDNFKLSITK